MFNDLWVIKFAAVRAYFSFFKCRQVKTEKDDLSLSFRLIDAVLIFLTAIRPINRIYYCNSEKIVYFTILLINLFTLT